MLLRTNKRYEYTKMEVVNEMIKGTKLTIRFEEQARKQVDKLIKYHTMSVKRLSRKMGLPMKAIRRFKNIHRNYGIES